MKNLIFLFPVILIGQSFTQLDVKPKQDGDQGVFRLFEKRVNGANFVSIIAPDSVTANTVWKWPAADTAGCFSSDGAGNIDIVTCAGGGGSFVTTNTAQSAGILTATKNWGALQSFEGGVRIFPSTSAPIWVDYTSYPVLRHRRGNLADNSRRIEFGFNKGFLSDQADIVIYTGNAGSEVAVSTMDFLGFDTTVEYSINGVTAIDSGRNGYLTSLTASDASVISGVTLTSGSIIGNNLNVNSSMVAASGFVNSLTINAGAAIGQCWTATSTGGAGSWQACGGGAGSFVTTNTIQAITARKDFQGPVVLENTLKLYPNSADPIWIDANFPTFLIRRGAAANNSKRLDITTNNGFFADQVNMNFYTGASGFETVFLAIGASGIANNVGYFANGSAGVTRFCGATDTIRQPTFIFGILTGGTCAF